jgi:transposase
MEKLGALVTDARLYEYLVMLPDPWTVKRVAVNAEERRVDIWAGHRSGVIWPCPGCDRTGPCRDHAPERFWRHMDCCNFEAYLHARIPRVACLQHGVRQVFVPWADPDSRFTRPFERFALQFLDTCTVSGTAGLLALTWDEARGIQQRAAKRHAGGERSRSFDRRLDARKVECVH